MTIEMVLSNRLLRYSAARMPRIMATGTATTVGTAARDVLLAPKRDRARTTITGAKIDLCLIQKFHRCFSLWRRPAESHGSYDANNSERTDHDQPYSVLR